MTAALALSPAAQCVCGHTYGEHALHANSGERTCMEACPCEAFRFAPCEHGEENWRGCPACLDDERGTRRGELEADL